MFIVQTEGIGDFFFVGKPHFFVALHGDIDTLGVADDLRINVIHPNAKRRWRNFHIAKVAGDVIREEAARIGDVRDILNYPV